LGLAAAVGSRSWTGSSAMLTSESALVHFVIMFHAKKRTGRSS
jgi:hypothetical protein